MEYKDAKAAPKDGTVIIGDFKGYPFKTVCSWNGASKKWAVAELNIGTYEGEYVDTYFETEYYNDSDLLRWAEIGG